MSTAKLSKQEAWIAAGGGAAGGVIMFGLWLFAINRQLQRASRAILDRG